MTKLSYEAFLRAARRCCRTLSRDFKPSKKLRAVRWRTTTSRLFGLPLYVARAVNLRGTKVVPWNVSGAQAIGLFEFASRFGATMLRGRKRLGMPKKVTVFLLGCDGCGRRVIIDGNHRMTRLATRLVDVPAVVVELSGLRWPSNTPDMKILCACPKGARWWPQRLSVRPPVR